LRFSGFYDRLAPVRLILECITYMKESTGNSNERGIKKMKYTPYAVLIAVSAFALAACEKKAPEAPQEPQAETTMPAEPAPAAETPAEPAPAAEMPAEPAPAAEPMPAPAETPAETK